VSLVDSGTGNLQLLPCKVVINYNGDINNEATVKYVIKFAMCFNINVNCVLYYQYMSIASKN
jgi:ABC-type uncharacterized transport system permease subunit